MPTVTRFAPKGKAKFREEAGGLREWHQEFLAQIANQLSVDGPPDRRTPDQWKELLQAHRPDLRQWSPHPNDPQCYVERFEAEQRGNSLIFDVAVDWSNRQELPENPLAKPAEIISGTQFESGIVTLDKDNRPLVNTAGDLIEGLEEPFPVVVFRVAKNVAGYPPWLLTDLTRATNSDVVRIEGQTCPPRTLKIGAANVGARQSVIVAQRQIDYRGLELELLFNPIGWDKVILNRGTREVIVYPEKTPKGKIVVRSKVVPCKDPLTGDPVSEPVFLDRDGRRPRVDFNDKLVSLDDEIKALKQGVVLASLLSIKDPLDPSDIVVLKKRIRPELPFGSLPLR